MGGRHLRTEEALFRGLKQRAGCTYATAIITLVVYFVHFPMQPLAGDTLLDPPLLMCLPILHSFPKNRSYHECQFPHGKITGELETVFLND